MFIKRVLLIGIQLIILINLSYTQNMLSNLSADKNDPLFTTYAAPMERSEFIVDEGYQFRFYESDKGINFITDNGGYLCIAFKFQDSIKYTLDQMYSEPIITTSYSDLVKYTYQPYKNINVDVFFQVFSSRIAIQNIRIENNRDEMIQLDIYPFFQHPSGIQDVNISENNQYFTFVHSEPPTNWTIAHDIHHQSELANVYFISSFPDAWGVYQELGKIPDRKPFLKNSSKKDTCIEWGMVYHESGTLCKHSPPHSQFMVFHNGSIKEILTEKARLWDDSTQTILGNGIQRCQLGNFRQPPIAEGDSFSVNFTCLATNQQGTSHGMIHEVPDSIRTDIQLTTHDFPNVPQNVSIHFSQNNISAALSWESISDYSYHIYRRTGSTPGRYDLIAGNLASSGYFDYELDPDSTYGYIIVASDGEGNFSPHSIEVCSIGKRPLFDDMKNQFLSNTIIHDNSAITAFQKRMNVQPGQSDSIRIIRGVIEPSDNIYYLVQQCQDLQTYTMEQAVAEDEERYRQIPRINFPNKDYEMMYWSAFSMMRQCMLPPEGQCSYNYNVYSREPTWGFGHAGQVFHENISMLAYVYMDPISAQGSQWVFAERMNAKPHWPEGYLPFRIGPYLNEVNYYAGEYSSQIPLFNWENWEVFKISGDTTFLAEIYDYGKSFYYFWINERDDDQDGLCEWGGHSFWESVRDYNVIWDVLGGWENPHNANKVEALDLNCELVMEAKSLAKMADILDKPLEAKEWRHKAKVRADRINQLMWDPETHFYYHVDKQSHTFTYQSLNDLKHKEHIGFLPIWAGIADSNQINHLIRELHDPDTFGRPFGTPLMDYSDPEDPSGSDFFHLAIYPEWDFLTFKGLIEHYEMREEAAYLADRIFSAVIKTLKSHHDFYECYHANTGGPYGLHTYIWSGLVARMLIDLYGEDVVNVESSHSAKVPSNYFLFNNYPNPFNSSTVIRYHVSEPGDVVITVYDILGKRIKTLVDEALPAGEYQTMWNGKNAEGEYVPSGIYWYQMNSNQFVTSKKMIYIR